MADLQTKNKSKKGTPTEIAVGLVIIIAVIALVIWGASALISGLNKPKDATKANTPQTTTTNQTPTASLADLKAQVTPILTNQTNWEDNLMSNVQSAAGQSDAANSSSSFHQFWDDLEHSVKYDTVIVEYNKASNAYFNAHQTQPAALDTWNTDIQQVYTDIQNYARDTKAVLDDQTLGNPTDSDSAKVNSDQSTYKSDLAKARADITQL